MTLTAAHVASYRRDGFAVVEDFVPAVTCDRLRARMDGMLDRLVEEGARTVFSTADQRHAQDRWFLDSGDKVRCFFEADAVDEFGALTLPAPLAVNKVGHALHDLDPVFDAFCRSPELALAAAAIGFERPLLLQSMYIFKQPRIGGEVTCHQDSTFLHTQPLSCVGFWFALEDATEANGCMWAERGGHRRPLHARFVRDGAAGARMAGLDPAPLPSAGLEPLAARKGSLVLLHGSLPHRSGPNLSPNSRHAFTLHVIEGNASLSADNWLRRDPAMPLRGFG